MATLLIVDDDILVRDTLHAFLSTSHECHTADRAEQALAYLDSCLGRGGEGAMAPVLHPCDTFELLWSAYHLYIGGAPRKHVLRASERRHLMVDLANAGVSLSPSFPIPDADDTAVALLLKAGELLAQAGKIEHLGALLDRWSTSAEEIT